MEKEKSVFKDRGIVLFEQVEKEQDKRMILLLKDRGKVPIYIRGAMRANAPLRGVLMPFVYGEFVFFDGGKFLSITQGRAITHFKNILKDYEALIVAMEILDIVNQVIYPSMEAGDILSLVLMAFYYLNNQIKDAKLILGVFIHKLLHMEGFIDNQFCVCGSPLEGRILMAPGGIRCGRCGGKPVKDATKQALAYIYQGEIKEVFDFMVSKAIVEEIYESGIMLAEYMMERPMKTSDWL